jgi:acetyl esterase/lipase
LKTVSFLYWSFLFIAVACSVAGIFLIECFSSEGLDKTMNDDHYVDPEIKPALERMKARMAARVPMSDVPVVDMRKRARDDFAAMNAHPPALAYVENTEVEGAFGKCKARIYDATGTRTGAPGLIYFHGGGWIVGDLDSEDEKLRRLALASGIRIVSADYVLAPEHKFPNPLEDCIAAVKSIRKSAPELGLDAERLAIGGASAGANLALSTAIALRDDNISWLRFMLLFYGAYDMASQAPSRSLFNEGYGMTAEAMEFFYSLYLNGPTERTDPRASPLHADLTQLPPAFINAAGLDVLRDDSRSLAERLRESGVAIDYDEAPGVIHGYTLLAHEVAAARNTIEQAAHALRLALV